MTTPDCGNGGLTIVHPDLLDPSSGSIQVSPSGTLNINEGASGNFSVKLSAAPTRNATISLAKTNPDITLSPASLTFTTANWSTVQSVSVTAAEDADAIDDTDSITLSASGGITASSVTKAVSIDDDETAGLTPSTTRLNVDEGDSADFMVRLTGQPLDDVTVRLSQPTDGTANDDVTFDPTSLTFTTANWGTDQPVTVRAAEDADAGDDAATIDLTASGGGYAGISGSVRITVEDDDDIDGVPANFNPVTLADIAATEGSAIARRIALSRRPSTGVTVALASDNSDVTFASDAAGSTAITSLSFTRANWNTAQTFYTVLGDDSDTDNDTAEVTLSASGGDFAGVAGSYGVTVIDTGKPNIVPSRSPVVVDEGGGAVTVGVRLSEQPRFTGTFQFNVNLTITSSDPSVFTVTPSFLIFDSHDIQGLIWSDDQDLTITPVDDGTFTGAVKNATINIVASRDDNYRENYRTSDGTLTIPVQVRDDDPPPELTLSTASLAVAEDGDEEFTVRLKTRPSANVTVTLVQPTNNDVTVDDTSLTFTTGDWNMAQTVTVSAAEDDDAIADTAEINLTAAGGGYDGIKGSVEVSVTETDTAGLDISESSLKIDEDGTATFTVRLTSEPSDDVMVTFAQPTDGTANTDVTIDTDTGTNGDQNELTFTTSDWSTAQTVTISAVDDDDGDDDTATINLSATGGDYAGKAGSVSVTVDDDDGFELSVSRLTVNENSNATFTVKLTSQPSANVTVTLKQPDDNTNDDVTIDTDTGTNGNQNTLTFTTGNWNDTQTVTVRAAEDGDIDDDTARIDLTASGGGYGQVTGSLDVSVDDDDEVELDVSVSTLTVTEGSSSTFTVALDSQPSASVTVTLVRTGASSTDVTFDTDDKTAGNQDELTFTTTDWGAKTVTVRAAEDSDTDNEMATISLTAEGGGYDGKTASVTVTVTDDDGKFDLMPASLTVAEGGSNTFTVALTSQPSDEVTVTLAQTGTTNSDITVDTDSATAGNQDELTFTTTDWDDPQTVTVSAVDDDDAVVDTATIEVSTSGDGYGNFKSSLRVTVTETDTAGFKLLDSADDIELTGLKVTEGNRATFRVRLTSEPSESVTVTLVSSNSDVTFDTDDSTAGNQDELTFTVDNWDDPEPVTVSAGEDDNGEDDSATISLSAGGGEYAGKTASLTVSVEDDDDEALTVTPTDLTVAEGRSNTFTVVLTTEPSDEVTVTLSQPTDGTANSDVTFDTDDSTAGDQDELTFTESNWDDPQTVTVRAAADSDADAGESATINLTAEDGGYDGVTGSVTVDVTDTTPMLILEPATLTIDESESKVFTVRLSRQPQRSTTITLESSNGDVTLSLTSLTFTTSNWNAARTITVQTARDPDPDDDEAVVSLSGAGIVTGRVTVTVNDDGKIGLDLSAEELTVVEGEQGSFTVKLHDQPSANQTVNLVSDNDEVTLNPKTLTFTGGDDGNWNTFQSVTVSAADDEDNEDDTATISLTGTGITATSVTVTVTDDDTGATLEAEQAAATVILAEVVGALLPAAGDAIGRRFDAGRSGRTATVAGRQVALDRSLAEDLAAGFAARAGVSDASKQGRFAEDSFGSERHSSDWLGGIPLDAGRPLRSADQRSSAMSGASALLSDFSYALNAGASGGSGWSIWGRLDTGEFSGSNDGVEFDSSSSNIWFGADRRSDSGVLSGVAYSSSGSDADYTLGQFGAALETDLTLVLPYLEAEFDGGATGHAMLGVGSGEATITQTDKQQGSADLSVYMLTAGGSWPTLWEIGSAALSWSGDFGYTSLTTSGSELPSLDGLSVSSMQLRGGLELRFEELGYGWKTVPHAALLMRLDAGDGVTGTGFELTGGLQMASGSSERFSLDLNLRTLVMHSAEELTDWGMSIQVRVKPFGDGSGLGFALGPHWGAPEGDGLLQRDEAFRLDATGRQQRQLRGRERGLTADLGYGLRAFGGMLTPYSEYRITSGEYGSIRQLAGVRFSNTAALELRLFTERQIIRLGETRSRLAVELQKHY